MFSKEALELTSPMKLPKVVLLKSESAISKMVFVDFSLSDSSSFLILMFVNCSVLSSTVKPRRVLAE